MSPTVAPTWATATTIPSTDGVSAAAVADLLGLLVPGHPIADAGAEPPLRRFRCHFDRVGERGQLRGRIEPRRRPRVELARPELCRDICPQPRDVASDGPPPAPVGRGEPDDPLEIDRGTRIGTLPCPIGRDRERMRREEDQGVEQVLAIDLHDLELR